MIIAAYFFMHSSDRLYLKIINNPYYGSPIKNYIENHIIPIKTKIIILLSMWGATLITIYLTPIMRYPISMNFLNYNFYINIKIIGVLLALIGTIVVLRAKNK